VRNHHVKHNTSTLSASTFALLAVEAGSLATEIMHAFYNFHLSWLLSESTSQPTLYRTAQLKPWILKQASSETSATQKRTLQQNEVQKQQQATNSKCQSLGH
jgi:hypothetical protein